MLNKMYCEFIWQYSRFYGELLRSVDGLHEQYEDYSAVVLAFNVFEMICKSIRETDKDTIFNDVEWLADNNIITTAERDFINGENGFRKIRNIMMHKDIYEFFIEDNMGVVYPLADLETWGYIYNKYVPTIVEIIYHAVHNSLQLIAGK